jgi:transcription initiation factor IIE alpha subunit
MAAPTLSHYYCPNCQYYVELSQLPSDLCCSECGTALDYDELPGWLDREEDLYR